MIVDTETSGLDLQKDTLREFSVAVMDRRCERVRAECGWLAAEGAERLHEMAERLQPSLAVGILVAHNLDFDLAFLRRHKATRDTLLSQPGRWLCTMKASGGFVSLDSLAERCDVVLFDRHTAAGDTQGLVQVMTGLCAAARQQAAASIGDIQEIATLRCQSVSEGRGEGIGEPWESVLRRLPKTAPVPFSTPEQRSIVATIYGRLEASDRESGDPPSLKQISSALEGAEISAIALENILADSGIHLRDT